MSLLVPESGLLFWMLVSFGLSLLIVVKFGFPVILKKIDERKAYIDHSLEAAREADRRLADVRVEVENLIQQARAEREQMRKETMDERDRILREAQSEAAREGQKQLTEFRRQWEAEKADSVRQMRGEVVALSVGMAEKVLREKLADPHEQMALVDRLLDEALPSECRSASE